MPSLTLVNPGPSSWAKRADAPSIEAAKTDSMQNRNFISASLPVLVLDFVNMAPGILGDGSRKRRRVSSYNRHQEDASHLRLVFASLRSRIDRKNQFLYSRSQVSARFTRRSHNDFFANGYRQVGAASGACGDFLCAAFGSPAGGFCSRPCCRNFCPVDPALDAWRSRG